MKLYIKIIASALFVIGGIFVGSNILISKTEVLLLLGYLVLFILTLWDLRWYKLYYAGALICIAIAVFLFAIGPTMVRYVHYVDKASIWSYYFFATGVVFSAIDMFKGRKKEK
jgi:hypothetical protein